MITRVYAKKKKKSSSLLLNFFPQILFNKLREDIFIQESRDMGKSELDQAKNLSKE